MVILVVDDDPVSLMLAEHVLRAGGHDVVTAVNAEEARAAVQDQDGLFDAIVCDYMMPGENGLDLLEQLTGNSDQPCPPFVLLTGVSESDELDDDRVPLASAYLTKPVKSDELLAVVTAVANPATDEIVDP